MLMKMNIVRPYFVVVDGRCYRQLHRMDEPACDSKKAENVPSTSFFDTPDLYCDEPPCGAVVERDDRASDKNRQQDQPSDLDVKFNGKEYSAEMTISPAYYGVIIGQGGSTLKRIESETESRIKVPYAGASGPVVVTARTVRAVNAGLSRIEVLIESARKRFKATHFLSIPINSDAIKMSFDEFRVNVEKECGIKGQVFQRPERLHLTICLLLLNDKTEIKAAIDELDKCKHELLRPILENGFLDVHLSGLEYMNDDPGCVNVLYAQLKPTDNSSRLQTLADGLVQRFKARGLLHAGSGPSSVSDHVKLHVTLMNSIFCQSPDDVSVASQQRKPADRRTAFDATKILQTFRNYEFGPIELTDLHLSKRGEYNSKTGYYRSESTLSLI